VTAQPNQDRPPTDGAPPGPTGTVLLAINPTAGRGRADHAGATASRVLTGAGLTVLPIRASSGPELRARCTQALADGAGALVVVGGDGMVNLGVNLTAGTHLPLGIVAAGTGNDIARELGLPVAAPADAARVIADALTAGGTRALDAVHCTSPNPTSPAPTSPGTTGPGATGSPPAGPRPDLDGPDTGGSPPNGVPGTSPAPARDGQPPTGWFAGVLGAGFDAVVNERANGWARPRGRARYDLAIARELPVFRPRHYRLTLDGQEWAGQAMLVAVANGPAYGGGMRICPDALPDDGLLDVVILEPISRLSFIRLFPRVYSGTHLTHPRVRRFRGRELTVHADGIIAYADGERLAPLPLTCRVHPGAVRLLGPPPAPRTPPARG
jgi:diacylglycerol kinase (ATP)